MYEFKYKKEGYVALVKEYWKIYENDYYELCIEYPFDENYKPLDVINPEKDLRFTVLPKKKGIYPNIRFMIRKTGSNDSAYVRVFIIFERSVAFRDMKNEEDEWLDAYETVLELDKLVKRLYPGYQILDDDFNASSS